ncbi:hypothetical protein [Rothia endophytica]
MILTDLVELLDAAADSMRGTIQVELMMDSRTQLLVMAGHHNFPVLD